ncbi:MAG: hypothetical protein CFH10_01847 [Alphaproteobacteria bacterium MarineAlpha4_Bin2]|nr:MAG: hypothetical protein CFH10_01847 [Alphaproteobacteria bacterium MarineAlpha4_Bin2]
MKAAQSLAIEFNTFTILGRCARTGALGIVTATGEMAVGSRVPFVEDGVGAVATQALTDPRLGRKGLELLKEGQSATEALDSLAKFDPHIEARQLGIVDNKGDAAARTGSGNSDWKGHIIGDGFVSMGNRLITKTVVTAMAECFCGAADEPIWERLLLSIEAGRDAGGQHGGQRSAAIYVCDNLDYPLVDLRADDYDEPVDELRRLYDLYTPRIPYYRRRAADPSIGPFSEWQESQGLN